jgi:hypothetical protein
MVVAKQGPIAPGWEELGQAGPAGVLARQRIGLRDRVREIRRRRREQRAAESGLEVPVGRRRIPGTGRVPSRRSPPRDEPILYGSPGGPREAPRARQPEVEDAEADRGGDAAPDPQHGEDLSASGGLDPLREGPESSVPWGRDRE